MKRGPKIKTAANSRKGTKGIIRHASIQPTSTLSKEDLIEFKRLICVLADRGTLERVDLGVVTECARITGLLNQSHSFVAADFDPKWVGVVAQLTSQRRGLLRELGLTLQPSRSVVRTDAKDSQAKDPIEAFIKLA